MLHMIQGCKVPFPEKLSAEYVSEGNLITANVNAEDIEEIVKQFILMHKEPLFFILELPARLYDEVESRPGEIDTFHKDVYYIDGCTQEEALTILLRVGNLLIHDGLSSFGYGCHESGDEIMLEKYNVLTIFSRNISQYDAFLEEHHLSKTDQLLTAWDTFSPDSPGESTCFEWEGKTVYDIPKQFQEWGIYLAERREA